ncbi:MAG TPA: 2-oxo-4-hydroxy-4-carboxy-5-ureidoimidazoline decarboxylase, partial [Methylomirabilota bacterium]|nr:2-oxo-4-hydroxy-4-carboxy-5-ureidoimidazoline decarboxylase [Methylomirabilota bacterium]
MAAPLTLDAVNRMGPDELRQALGGVFESSPWVAERVGVAGPFPSVDRLHAAMTAVVREAPLQQRLALLRAHPDLAGRAARAGEMSAASVAEQSSAGLDR